MCRSCAAVVGRLLALASSHPVTLAPRQYGFDPVGDQAGDLFNLWRYRRIASRSNFRPGTYAGDMTMVNWPQNDYLLGNLVGVTMTSGGGTRAAEQLSLSLLYWLQTEAPRPDGKAGWPGLRLRGDVLGTEDGLAKYPTSASRGASGGDHGHGAARGTRRARGHGSPAGGVAALPIPTPSASAATASTCTRPRRRQLHRRRLAAVPDSAGRAPAGAGGEPGPRLQEHRDDARDQRLLPPAPGRMEHRRSRGALVAFASARRVRPHAIRQTPALLADYQRRLVDQGVELSWPR